MHQNPSQAKAQTGGAGFDQFRGLAGKLGVRRLSFYLGVPLALALYGAVNNEYAAAAAGLWPTLVFYFAHAFVPWWTTCFSTQFVFVALNRFEPAAPIVWALGGLLSCVLVIPYLGWIGVQMPGAEAASAEAMTAGTVIVYALRAVIVWMLVNWFFERVVRLPRWRYAVNDAAASYGVENETTQAALQIPGEIRTELPESIKAAAKIRSIEELYSVSAEEHYVRIHTVNGDYLVYKRFADAVKELEAVNGMRIHRSHWVSPYGVAGIARQGKRMFVKLKDGTQLPVSRPYQELVRSMTEKCGVHIRPASRNAAEDGTDNKTSRPTPPENFDEREASRPSGQ